MKGLSFVTNRSLTNVSGFQNVNNLLSLHFDDNAKLQSIDGLTNMDSISSLRIINTGFVQFNEFNSLKSIRNLSIQNNFYLESLDGFGAVENIGYELEIKNCDLLTSITGFDRLKTVEILRLDGHEVLEDVSGFSQVSTVNIGFYILGNKSLRNLRGFENLETVGVFDIQQNEELLNFSGLESMVNVGGLFRIRGNSALRNLEGLENITQLGFLTMISNNFKLESLKGLENVTSCGSNGQLEIMNNILLNNIEGIGQIDYNSYDRLEIANNTMLSICNNPNVCGKITLNQPENTLIYNNAEGCNTTDEVAFTCNLNRIEGNLSFDFGNNNCLDGVSMEGVKLEATDGTKVISTFTDDKGNYLFDLSNGSYTTSPIVELDWLAPNRPNQNTTFTEGNETDMVDFCFSANMPRSDVAITIFPPEEARPGFEAEYILVYQNHGSNVTSGEIELNFEEEKLEFLGGEKLADEVLDGKVKWSYDSLLPFQSQSIKVRFRVEPPPIADINQRVFFLASISPSLDDHSPLNNTFTFTQTLIGSYDPNDKTVLEGRSVLIEDTDNFLNYVVRFQNTGTASAINVRIFDELSEELDWSTFAPVASSHNNTIKITDGNKVEFLFENINLPDSISNEPESHGFVVFKIKPKSSIAVGDVITGKARIFFDFNPPIVTNEVKTTIISEIPEPLAVNVVLNAPISCQGDQDAVIEATTFGGLPPYQYDLVDQTGEVIMSNGEDPIFTGLGVGRYQINARDSENRTAISNAITISEPLPLLLTVEAIDITCKSLNNGEIRSRCEGGAGDYEFSVDGVVYQPSGTFPNLSPGTYTVFARDVLGCNAQVTIIIAEPVADFDNDGIGDACDNDIDGDGVHNDIDQCIGSSPSEMVDDRGCPIFSLPPDNFVVQTNSASCRNSDNGSIRITAKEGLTYLATLRLGGQELQKPFNDMVSFDELKAGTYELCISVTEYSYENCYSLNITQPEALSVVAEVDQSGKSIVLNLTGGQSYEIFINDEKYITNKERIELPLKHIENNVVVKTDKDCQGIFNETHIVTSGIVLYPNPVGEEDVTIRLPNLGAKPLQITLFSENGQTILKDEIIVSKEGFTLNMAKMASGVYILGIKTEDDFISRRIIKN